MPRKADQYRAHVASLCEAYGVDLEELDRSGGGRAIVYLRTKRRVIRVPAIRGPVSYWVALHELGHHVARGRSSGGRIDKELVAWRWAAAEARFPPPVSVRRAVVRSLRSYVEWALARQYRRHGRPRLPGADHGIWAFMEAFAVPEEIPELQTLRYQVERAG